MTNKYKYCSDNAVLFEFFSITTQTKRLYYKPKIHNLPQDILKQRQKDRIDTLRNNGRGQKMYHSNKPITYLNKFSNVTYSKGH